MTELLTAAQMRAIEQGAIDSGAVTGLELMERAGRGVVEAALEWRPELAEAPHRAVVLCGPGNNGGDGFVVARLLKQRGWDVEVFLYGDEAKLPPDAAENCRRWREMGSVTALTLETIARHDAAVLPNEFVVVDALFGTGLSRRLDGDTCQLISAACATGNYAFASWIHVDLPSGLCADSGRGLWTSEPPYPYAALTVTFHRPKIGHYLSDGPNWCRRVVCKDIGLAAPANQAVLLWSMDAAGFVAEEGDKVGTGTHKYEHGHALVLSGGVGKGGAARLAARGALRIGAGVVTVGVPPAALIENAAQLNAIMLRAVGDAEALRQVLEDPRINALCLGPGMGVSERTRAMVLAVLASKRACVLDADALTVFENDPVTLFDALHETCVLTPHAGEFKRLFPEISAKLDATPTKGPAYSKVDATREAAARAGCVVLYKGADTVIAAPSGRCAINSAHYERAAPWLATAGSGDVLAGFIAGLLARGFAPMAAAETAAWLHVECARSFGPGLIAEDLPEQLPQVFRSLGL